MADSNLQSLFGAVRRRLWRGRFGAVARLSLWGTAGLMLLAVAVHLAVRPVRVEAALLAIAILWASTLVWAGLRRPSDSACALWADRHLDGASAFGTLLEMRRGTHALPNAEALRWLEHWTTARAPHSLRLLGERRDSARLSRPLLAMLVCAALATVVLRLPDLAPSARTETAASSPSGTSDRPTPVAETTASTSLVGELASALRSAASRPASDRPAAGGAKAAGPGNSDKGNGSRMAPPGAAVPGDRSTARVSRPGTSVDATPAAGGRQASGAGSGREAGDSPDDRADAGLSRVPRGTIPVQRLESSAGRGTPERQADMDQLASFDEDSPTHRVTTLREDPAPAAATPPPATETTPLTATRAAYVQAWMKASGQRR